MENFSNGILKYVQEYQSFVLILFVPLYALMAKLVFFNIKKFNYTELLVVFMYLIAQTSIVGTLFNFLSALLGLKMGMVTPFYLAFQIAYSAFCLKRLYSLSFKGIILRTLLFFVVLIVVYLIFVVTVIGIIFTTKGPEFFKEMIHAQNATKRV